MLHRSADQFLLKKNLIKSDKMAVSEKSKKNLQPTPGNPTGALSQLTLANMKAMAAFGRKVHNKVNKKLLDALDDEDKYLKSCEIILRYTCPIPKDISGEQGVDGKLVAGLFERLETLQKERDDALEKLSER